VLFLFIPTLDQWNEHNWKQINILEIKLSCTYKYKDSISHT